MQAMLRQGLLSAELIHATVNHEEKARAMAKDLGVRVSTDNIAAVRESEIALVCVKPQVVGQVMEQIAPVVTPEKVLISVAASVPTDYMEKRLPEKSKIIRAIDFTRGMRA